MNKTILPLLLPIFLFAKTGLEIAEKVDNRKTPKDMTADLSMVLTNKKGKTRTSKIHSVTIDGGKKQIIWFLAPADDKGVSFLKIEHDDKDDEMRMWLPAFKKIRRISAKKKGDSFMGSDMSYEDMSNRELSDHTYQRLEDERVGDADCFVIEVTPNSEAKSNYKKHKTWIEKARFIPLKEESYDRKGKLKKTKTFSYADIKDYVTPTEIYVEDVQKNHSTRLVFDNIKLDSGINDKLFHEKSLKRMPRN